MIESGTDRLKVTINSSARVRFQDGTMKNLRVVNDSAISPDKGIISYKSPVGKVLLGAEVNEKKKYKVNGKTFSLKVLKITH